MTKLNSRKVDLVAGDPFWPHFGREPKRYPKLETDIDCDVLVIGGGITGALVSDSLIEAGANVVLIDQGRFGGESTSASTAMISYDFDETLVHLAKFTSMKSAVRCYELCFEAVQDLARLVKRIQDPCDYDAKAALRIDTTGRHGSQFEAEEKAREKSGFPMKLLDRDQLERRFGICAHRGLESTNAAQIDPLWFTRSLIKHSVSQGMIAFEQTQAVRFDPDQSGVTVFMESGFRVRAKKVVFATGYASEKYLGPKLALLTTDFCVGSKPLVDLDDLEKCHFVEETDDYLYASSFGDRIIAGIQDAAYFAPKRRQEALRDKTEKVLERCRELLLQHRIAPEFRWAGTFARSRDSLPYLVQPEDFPHAIFVLGYGGNGIAASAMLAPIARDLALDRKNPDAKLFAIERG